MFLRRLLMKKLLVGTTALFSMLSLLAHAKDLSVMYGETFADAIEPGIAQYEKDTGNTVIRQKIPAATIYDQKLSLDFIGGQAADLMLVDSYTLSSHVEAGYLRDISPFVSSWPEWQSVYDNFKNSVTFDNKIYALPLDTDVRMMYYNIDTFKEHGIEVPWQPKNWDELIATAEKLKAEGVEQSLLIPVGVSRGEETTMQGFYMLLLGADVPTDDRNRLRDWNDGKWIVDSPALRKTLGFYKDVYMDKKLSPYSAYTQSYNLAARVKGYFDGSVGIWFDGSWRYVEMFFNTGVEPTDELIAKIAYARVPGSGCEGCLDYTNISGGWTLAMNEKVSDIEEAAKLMEYIYGKEYFTNWINASGKISTRGDAAESEAYMSNAFVSGLTDMVKGTTLRDTYPGYLIVTQAVQQMTQDIVDGKSVDEALARYKESLDFEFGADNLKTYE